MIQTYFILYHIFFIYLILFYERLNWYFFTFSTRTQQDTY